MRALVVYANPGADSFNRAMFETAVVALRSGGHEVVAVDLCAEGFVPSMSKEERVAYYSTDPIPSPQVARHVDLVRGVEMLVFVYPTWCFGLPAVLKGWLERVLVPGVGFVFDPDTRKVRPHLLGVRRIVGISTYGATWLRTRRYNDAGRRTLARGLRFGCTGSARVTWLAMYRMNRSTSRRRADFLATIERRLAAL